MEWYFFLSNYRSPLPDQELEGVGETPSKEVVKLPAHASNHLMRHLFKLCAKMHTVGALDLDRSLLIAFTINFGKSLLKTYTAFASTNLPEKANLQLLFDVLFSIKLVEQTWLLDASDFSEKLEFKREAHALIALYKSRVDPIDLAVFQGPLSVHVDRFYSRHIVLLSPLMMFARASADSRYLSFVTECIAVGNKCLQMNHIM